MRNLTLAILVLSLIGCANLNLIKPYLGKGPLSAGDAYLFGKFDIERYGGNGSSIWIKILSLDDNVEYVIKFDDVFDVVAIPVKPGNYQVVGAIHTKGRSSSGLQKSEVHELEFPAQGKIINNSLFLERGKAYYIGDYLGLVGTDSLGIFPTGSFVMISAKYNHGIKSFSNNYEQTKKELLSWYSALSGLEFHNAL